MFEEFQTGHEPSGLVAPQPLPGGSTQLRRAGSICYISSTWMCGHAVDMKVYRKHSGPQLSKPFQGKDAAVVQRFHARNTGSGHACSRRWEQSQQMAVRHSGWQQAPAEGLRLYSPHWLPYVLTVAHHHTGPNLEHPLWLQAPLPHTAPHFSSWLSYLLDFCMFL